MTTLHTWLGIEPSPKHLLRYLMVSVVLCWFISLIGHAAGMELAESTLNVTRAMEDRGFLRTLYGTSIEKPIQEEAYYRLAPLGLLWVLFQGTRPPLAALVPVVLASSAYFGWVHGEGVPNLLMHGSIGVVLAIVMVKWSGNGAHPLRGFFAAVLVHGSYNLCHAIWKSQVLYG